MTVKLLTEHHSEFLSLKGGCTGLSESTVVKLPHCWKSHVVARICFHVCTARGQRIAEARNCACETCGELENYSRGVLTTFFCFSHQHISQKLQKQLDPTNWTHVVQCYRGASVPEFLRKPITTCEFPGV